jgi:hypothetical protein
MLRERRTWSEGVAQAPEDVARELTSRTWTGCTCFKVKGQKGIYLFLNDSTSADGAQEYAVVKRTEDGRYFQLESVTFSWCSHDWALWFVRAVAADEFDEGQFVREVFPRLEPERNHACHLCV